MSDIRADIATYLKKNGPAKPRQILDAIGGKASAVNYALRAMLKAKELTAAGTTLSRTYGLPGQALEAESPAPAKKPRRHAAKKKRAARKARRVQRRPKKQEVDFLPAITAENEIVVFNGAAPVKYSAEQSRALADLVFANFTQ